MVHTQKKPATEKGSPKGHSLSLPGCLMDVSYVFILSLATTAMLQGHQLQLVKPLATSPKSVSLPYLTHGKTGACCRETTAHGLPEKWIRTWTRTLSGKTAVTPCSFQVPSPEG